MLFSLHFFILLLLSPPPSFSSFRQVSREDFIHSMRSLNLDMSDEELNMIVDVIDEDHSNSMELKEFNHVLKRVKSDPQKVSEL